MIWHQIQENGLQSTVLTLVAVMLPLVLSEVAIAAVAVFTQTTGIPAMLRASTPAFLSGVHFICSLESEVRSRKSDFRCPESEGEK